MDQERVEMTEQKRVEIKEFYRQEELSIEAKEYLQQNQEELEELLMNPVIDNWTMEDDHRRDLIERMAQDKTGASWKYCHNRLCDSWTWWPTLEGEAKGEPAPFMLKAAFSRV